MPYYKDLQLSWSVSDNDNHQRWFSVTTAVPPSLNHTSSNHCIYQNQAVRPTRPLKINFPLTKRVILVPRRADLAVPLPCSPCHSPCHFRYWSTPIGTSSSPRARGHPCRREDGGVPYRSELDHVASYYVTAGNSPLISFATMNGN